ncbi:MAG: hypothetical protein ACKO2L_15515, partial [Planctomycetaceae bacterium]
MTHSPLHSSTVRHSVTGLKVVYQTCYRDVCSTSWKTETQTCWKDVCYTTFKPVTECRTVDECSGEWVTETR